VFLLMCPSAGRSRVSAVSDRSVATASPWVRGPAWDSVWILSALWLLPIAWWLARGYENPEESPLDMLYFGLTVLFWIGHRLSSTYLAYCTEAYRPLLRKQPIRFVALPLLVTAACFAVFLPADEALPWSREQRLIGVAIVDYVFVTYHFAAQHFGAFSLYRTRAGRTACVYTRTLDRMFALGVGGALVVLADVLAGAAASQEYWNNAVPDWIFNAQDVIRTGAMIVLGVATLGMLAIEARSERWSLPRVLYTVGLAGMVAIALAPRSPFLFLVLWTSQHWIMATGLASLTPGREPAPGRRGLLGQLHHVNVRPWAVLALLTVVSIVSMPLFEVEANRDGGTYYGDRLFGAFGEALRSSAWVPALLALGFATGFVHYLLDRSVYRMSDPDVRTAARGLLSRPEPPRDPRARRAGGYLASARRAPNIRHRIANPGH
jgi:hypothetical protein